MDLSTGSRVVIQLAPAFAPVHVANIRAFARSGWWNGGKSAIYRVQDNYVVQWGRNETDDPLPAGVVKLPPAEYHRRLRGLAVRPLGYPDPYAPRVGHALGWPIAYDPKAGTANLTHCYGYVGVARDLCAKWWIELPDKDLAYLAEGTDEFWSYISEMRWAQRYALTNRQLMMDAVIAAAGTTQSDTPSWRRV